MTTDAVTVIYNPTAARGRAARRIDAVSAAFDRHGLAHRLEPSREAGGVETAVWQAAMDGATRIIVAGGDGSVHEAANGLMRASRETALGVVPLGTGNDFAKACSIPQDASDAAELLAERIRHGVPPRTIDVGRMNGRYFINGAGIGFDARVSEIADGIRWPIGDLVYLVAVFRGLLEGCCTPSLTLEYNGLIRHGPLTLASISNGSWVGGMFPIAPMARNDDGQFELVFADPLSRLAVMALLPSLLQGKHIGRKAIHHAAVTSCRIRAEVPLASHLDGENQPPATEFEIELLPEALRLA